MERRQLQRFAANQEAEIQVLGVGGSRFRAKLIEVSGGGMQFAVPRQVPAGALLKVEFGDTLVLAEVAYCHRTRPDGSKGDVFTLGVKADQVLAPLPDLIRLQKALQAEAPPVAEPATTERQD